MTNDDEQRIKDDIAGIVRAWAVRLILAFAVSVLGAVWYLSGQAQQLADLRGKVEDHNALIVRAKDERVQNAARIVALETTSAGVAASLSRLESMIQFQNEKLDRLLERPLANGDSPSRYPPR